MQATSIQRCERRAIVLARASVLATAVLAGGCSQLLDIEDLPPPPTDFAVRGTAAGLLEPVALELRLGNDVELLSVTRDGAFTFDTRLDPGASYTVILADPAIPCTLRNQTGVIADADTAIELTCTGASLASVLVSGIAPPTITIVPGTTDYMVDLPLLQQSVTLTATVAVPGDTITIAGTPVASGASSAEFTLDLGDNAVDIVVENERRWQRTYRLTLRRTAQPAQYAYGKASNTDGDDNFGFKVALSGDTLAVAAYFEDSVAQGVGGNQNNDEAPDSGAVYVFRRTGMAWQQEAYLKASNTGADDRFGFSLALSGDTLAVGALFENSAAQGVNGDQNNDAAPHSGAVYVFRRTGTTWQQEAYLKASNAGAGDEFGHSLALSGDTLAVGAVFEDSAAQGVDGNQDDDQAPDSGAAYVFRRTGTGWQQEAYLKASNTGAGDRFGFSLALSGDTVAVGAVLEDSAAQGVGGDENNDEAPESGAVYVFRRIGAGWQHEAYLKASDASTGDFFGHNVALSGDTLAVAADGAAGFSGTVYVFGRTGAGWQEDAHLEASNTEGEDRFGRGMALSGDTVAVGAVFEDSAAQGVGGNQADNQAMDSGAVYVFGRTGTTWQQEAYIKASNTGAGDLFGQSVALSGDTLAVAAIGEASEAKGVGGNQASDSTSNSGAVYVFH